MLPERDAEYEVELDLRAKGWTEELLGVIQRFIVCARYVRPIKLRLIRDNYNPFLAVNSILPKCRCTPFNTTRTLAVSFIE